MFNLFSYDLCIQSQIELLFTLLCEVLLPTGCAVSYLVGVKSVSVQMQRFHFQVRFWRKSETQFQLQALQCMGRVPKGERSCQGLELQGPGFFLPLRELGQGKMVSLPAGGVCWGSVCVTKVRSFRKRLSDCAALETTEGNGSSLRPSFSYRRLNLQPH